MEFPRTRPRVDEEEEHELSDDLKGSENEDRSSSERGLEQEEALLGGWKEARNEEELYKLWPWTWRRALVPTLVGVAVLVLLVTATLLAGPRHDAKSGTNKTDETLDANTVQANDYILETSWDYSAPPQRREYFWTIQDVEHNPDGIYRPMMLINKQFPGPLVEVNEGDTIVVHVDNQAVNATSIHWHGLYQNGTAHMDGTVGITQCPIAPGGQFTYEFTVTGQSGTYWYHAHQGVQASDGLIGPLIIHAKNEREMQKIEYATDRIIMVQDYYYELSSALLWQYLKPNMENEEPVPNGALINGRYIRDCNNFPDRKCDNTTANVGIPTLDLAPNQNHRLRIINVGAFAEFQFQIDEHELAVTEVDGTDVLPMSYHRLNINPAQRYSVVVNTNVTTANAFWLRARMISSCFKNAPRDLDAEVRAIVRYDKSLNEKVDLPHSTDWKYAIWLQCRDMNTSELVPMEVIAAPQEADAFFYLRSNFEIGAYRLSRGFFNQSSWRPNVHSPTLLRAADGLAANNDSFSATSVSSAGNENAFVNDAAFDSAHELVIQTNGIQTIDILISNFDDGNHPIHLHGYKYFVLAGGNGYPPRKSIPAAIDRDNLSPLYDSLDLSNPLRRDTASVEGFGWLLLRLVADNPGAWAFHCHISWHTEAGLLMQLVTRSDEIAKMQIPNANRDLCLAAGLENGTGPNDSVYAELVRPS